MFSAIDRQPATALPLATSLLLVLIEALVLLVATLTTLLLIALSATTAVRLTALVAAAAAAAAASAAGAPIAGTAAIAAALTAALTTTLTTAISAVSAPATAIRTTSTGSTSRSVVASAALITSTATSAGTLGLGSLVNANGTTIEFNVVHGGNRVVSISVVVEANKAEAAATTGVAILHDDSFLNLAKFLELGAESFIVSMPGKAANEELGHDCLCR